MAYPFSLLHGEKSTKSGKGKSCDYFNLVPAQILEDAFTFSSRVFMVRFSEEFVELQDICQFRAEVDCFPLRCADSCCLQAELFFADVSAVGPPELLDGVDVAALTAVSKQVVQIIEPEKGLLAFVPVTFDMPHYSVANLVIHSSIIDYKYRPVLLCNSQSEDVVKIVERKSRSPSKSLKKSLEDILAPANGVSKMNHMELIYDKLIQPLVRSHKVLGNKIEIMKGSSSQ